jgi:hypothetical protein
VTVQHLSNGRVETFRTTDEHPFWGEKAADGKDGTFRPADRLAEGDSITVLSGDAVVVSLHFLDDREDVYNLSVAGVSSFLVGSDGAWVHNCVYSANSTFQYSKKIADKMRERGWTDHLIDEVIISGQRIPAIVKGTGNPATRYVHARTGQSVVVDDVTDEIIHIGGPGFKYSPASGDLP